MRILALRKMYSTQSTAETACAMTVAYAAPATPICRDVIMKMSSTTLSTDEKMRNTSGITEFPIARRSPAQRL